MKFEQKRFKSSAGLDLGYIAMIPENVIEPPPLLIFFHGVGERGNDNSSQLTHGRDFLTTAVMEYKVRVIAPQCPEDDYWVAKKWDDPDPRLSPQPTRAMAAVIELLKTRLMDYQTDLRKIYVMGLSMGGFATWEIIQRYPEIFAAAVPICGGGDQTLAKKINRLPLWAFHGDADPTVPVEQSRRMIDAIKKAGGRPRYTEYPNVGHDCWNNAFAEPALLDWMLSKTKR